MATPELAAIVKCTETLARAMSTDIFPVANTLLANDLITETQYSSVHSEKNSYEKASLLMIQVRMKVEVRPDNYGIFLKCMEGLSNLKDVVRQVHKEHTNQEARNIRSLQETITQKKDNMEEDQGDEKDVMERRDDFKKYFALLNEKHDKLQAQIDQIQSCIDASPQRGSTNQSLSEQSPDITDYVAPPEELSEDGAPHDLTDSTPLAATLTKFLGELEINEAKKRALVCSLNSERKLGIMACGLTGSGKSTLLNGIIGKRVFEAGGHTADSTTHGVEEYAEKNENSTILIFDTPGFKESKLKEAEYLQQIKSKRDKVDILLYCMVMESKITDSLKQNHVSTLSKLKGALHKKVWKHCIIVLTEANFAIDRLKLYDAANFKANYDSTLEEWKVAKKEMLTQAKITKGEIPVILAGERTPKLLEDDKQPWLCNLWHEIYNKSSTEGQSVLFHFNAHRLKEYDPDECQLSSEHDNLEIELQPIPIDPTFMEKLLKNLKENHHIIAAALATGSAAGAAGAGIGATIGALAIGIPTFGVAAGVGLLLGGLIGGAVGVGVGTATGTGIRFLRRRNRTAADLTPHQETEGSSTEEEEEA